MDELWDAIHDLYEARGLLPLNRHKGCVFVKVDANWSMTANGQKQAMRCHKLNTTVAPFSAYVEFNGWPWGVIDPMRGQIGNGSKANMQSFISAIRESLKNGREGQTN